MNSPISNRPPINPITMNSQTNQEGRFTNVTPAHTPAPWGIQDATANPGTSVLIWSLDERGNYDFPIVRFGSTARNAPKLSGLERANAAFIVEAVNSYHAHLERIARLEEVASAMMLWLEAEARQGYPDGSMAAFAVQEMVRKARAAIKGD